LTSSEGDLQGKNGGGKGGFMGRRGRRGSDGSEGKRLNREESVSERHYADRYVAGWVAPDFDAEWGVSNERGKGGNAVTVERAQMPFDHINALQNK
jgi:hypothetical protein